MKKLTLKINVPDIFIYEDICNIYKYLDTAMSKKYGFKLGAMDYTIVDNGNVDKSEIEAIDRLNAFAKRETIEVPLTDAVIDKLAELKASDFE